MYSIRSKFGPNTAFLGLMVTLITYSLTGCDGADSGMTQESSNVVPISETTSLSATDIDFARVVPFISKSGESKLLLRVGLKNSSRWRNRLGGLRILSKTKDEKPIIIRDDGKNGDARASDGIFSGYITDGCIPEITDTSAGKKFGWECTVLFVGPGHECGEFGECPERVHRSFFWGLIEYDTNIVFCVCLSECTASNN